MTIQAYTAEDGFPAPLVCPVTQQGVGVSDDAGARLAHTAPGSVSAFAPVRQAAGPLPADSNAVYGDEDPLEINFPLRSGEKAVGGHDDGSPHDAFRLITTPGGPWKQAPPGGRNVNQTWVQG